MTLRVLYAGYDFFSSCLQMLTETPGIEVAMCWTGKPDEAITNVVKIAGRERIPVMYGRPDYPFVEAVRILEPDLIISAAYSYRIPIHQIATPKPGINVHPSLLPYGRGANSLPHLVSGYQEHCGITLHLLTDEYDSGPILRQECIPLSNTDGFDELALKMFALAPMLLAEVMSDFDGHVRRAETQGQGSYWREHTAVDRTLVAAITTVRDVRLAHRQFGRLGLSLTLGSGDVITATSLTAVACGHTYQPGSLVATPRGGAVVALADGLARLDTFD